MFKVDSSQLRSKLASVNRTVGSSDVDVLIAYVDALCDGLERLKRDMETTEPRIVVDERDPTKSSALNHLTLEGTALVASVLETIVCWALHPVLSFQLPAASRSEEFLALTRKLTESYIVHLSKDLTLPLKALKILYGCLNVRELAILVIDGSMVDVIPALVKLGFEKSSLPTADVQWANGSFKALITSSPIPSPSIARLLLLHLSLKPANAVALRVLSSAIYMLLCERKDGFTGVLSAFLDTKSGVVDMEASLAAAKTIANPPKSIEMEAYLLKLCPQILGVLRVPRTPHNDKFISCASIIFGELSTRFPTLTVKHWLAPALSPLTPFLALFLHNQSANGQDKLDSYLKGDIDPKSKPITRPKIQLIEEIPPTSSTPTSTSQWSLEPLSKWNAAPGVVVPSSVVQLTLSNALLLLYASGETSFVESFEPVVPFVATVLSKSTGKKHLSVLEKDATDFLQRFFSLCEPRRALSLLEYLALRNFNDWRGAYGKIKESNAKALNFELHENADNTGLSILCSELEDNSVPMDIRQSADEVVQLLKVLDSEMPGVFFLKLLEDLFSTMTIAKSLSDDNGSLASLGMEDRLVLLQTVSERQIRQMHILMPLLEQIGPSVLRNVVQICLFIKSMLDSDEDEEIQVLVLTILKEVLAQSIVTRSEADILLVELLTPLKTFFNHQNEFISGLAHHCYEEISRSVQNGLLKDDAESDSKAAAEESEADKTQQNPSETAKKRKWVLNPHASSVDEALKMISNPLIPIRAGGLIQLRRFLLREDKDALAKLPHIMDTFVAHLSNSDSYVYLGAIQGLSAIADVLFDLAMPKLAEQYQNPKRPLEIRLNVGESILQVARRLALALPKYAAQFFSLLLSSAQKDPEALMRASSLSNIGEVCELLRFGLLPYIEELMAMIYDILLVEKDAHVRRGCIFLVCQLFKGLSKDILVVIPSHLHRIYALLEAVESSGDDLVLREHAAHALDLYRDGIESAIRSVATPSAHFLEPTGFYDSLRIIK